MTTIILVILPSCWRFFLPGFISSQDPAKHQLLGAVRFDVRMLCAVAALIIAASTSFVYVDKDQAGHLDKVYLGDPLRAGATLTTDGEKGPQADILPPGFHFQPFLQIQYDVTMREVIEFPSGQYGFLSARDGTPLRDEQTYADPFPAADPRADPG